MAQRPHHRARIQWLRFVGLAGDGPGGAMARWLLPAAIVAPVAIDLVIVALERAGLLTPGGDAAFDGVATAVFAVVAIVLAGRLLDRLDRDRRARESELRISEQQFKQIFDDAPSGYHELDREGRLTRVNRTELTLLGYALAEMVGRPVWEFLSDQGASRAAVLQKLAGALAPLGNHERVYCRKDGTPVSVLVQDRILRDDEGRITGIRTTLQDITHLKRMQAEREALIMDLQETLAEIKTLKGFIPICSSCKKVRDDQGCWEQVEAYVIRHTDASFSHGICPDCAKTLYPELQGSRGAE